MRYQHNCEKCVPLGEFGELDLYFCGGRDATVIARYGNDGGDYSSGLMFAEKIPALGEAKRRAIDAGLLNP